MPLYKAIPQEGTALAAIWKITEPETFFSDQLGFSSEKKLERRRLEYLASRFLLWQLAPGFPFSKIEITAPGKPFLRDAGLHFSISHSFPYVAVAIDKQPVGIDVQVFQEKISRLKDKFLSPAEQVFFGDKMEPLTLAWSAKEAAYKWFGDGGMDFIHHLPIRDFQREGPENASLQIEFLRSGKALMLPLKGGLEADFAWSVTVK
jgi:phosphopantetheinyl transferase